jgi:hypothetical protein
MQGMDTSPEPALERVESTRTGGNDDAGTDYGDQPEDRAGFVQLFRELADDTRTLVQQEIELVRLEVAHSTRRVAVDGAWISAGAVIITVGLVCLALALALGLGALLDSYWLGTLITAAVFLLAGGLFAWRGIRDLTAGGLMPTGPVRSLREDRDWARRELDELKQGLTEERT